MEFHHITSYGAVLCRMYSTAPPGIISVFVTAPAPPDSPNTITCNTTYVLLMFVPTYRTPSYARILCVGNALQPQTRACMRVPGILRSSSLEEHALECSLYFPVHLIRIAIEGSDVLFDPLEGSSCIQHAIVASVEITSQVQG